MAKREPDFVCYLLIGDLKVWIGHGQHQELGRFGDDG
jgi:hypothetical protein